VTLKRGENIKYQPFAFTEHGILMLSSVLRSEGAIAMNIAIMRTFVKLREMLASQKDLVRRLDDLERKYDKHFQVVFDTIRQLMTPPLNQNINLDFVLMSQKQSTVLADRKTGNVDYGISKV
jgi:hypothetical protein